MNYKSLFASDNCRLRKKEYKNNKRNYKLKPWQISETQFRCKNCKEMIFYTSEMGTAHRNHCNKCLWSLHVDIKPGDRSSECYGRMEPIGLTFKHNGFNKYGNSNNGDIMLVHLCRKCGKININRISADDPYYKLIEILENFPNIDNSIKEKISLENINLLNMNDIKDLETAYYGIYR